MKSETTALSLGNLLELRARVEWQAGQSERGNARRVNEFMIRKCSKSSAVYLTVGSRQFALSTKVWKEIFLGSDIIYF